MDVYVDGACNPWTGVPRGGCAPGGVGVVSKEEGIFQYSLKKATPYRMELLAIVIALRMIEDCGGTVFSDAKSIICAAINRWQFGKRKKTSEEELWECLCATMNNRISLRYIAKKERHPLHHAAHLAARQAMRNAW